MQITPSLRCCHWCNLGTLQCFLQRRNGGKLRKLTWVGVEVAHQSGLFLSRVSGKLVQFKNCVQWNGEWNCFSGCDPVSSEALWLQSGSISLLTFLVSPLLFCQLCIISCFEPSPGCEGNGEIPVWLCYLVAGDGKLCWSCCRADVSVELQWFCRKALHCTGPICIPCTPLRASQSLWMNSLCQNVTRTIVFALNQAHLWRGREKP